MKSGSYSSYRAALSGTGADIGGERDDAQSGAEPTCGCDSSNFVLLLESQQWWCTLCDLRSRCRDAEDVLRKLTAALTAERSARVAAESLLMHVPFEVVARAAAILRRSAE